MDEILDGNYVIDDRFIFDEVIFEKTVVPHTLNEHEMNDVGQLSDLIVDGRVSAKHIDVDGMVDGIKFNSGKCLMKNGDQTLSGGLTTTIVDVDHIETDFLNKESVMKQKRFIDDVSTIDTSSIVVKNLNNINFPSLRNLLLQNIENQQVASSYRFEKLVVNNFHSDGPISDTIVPQSLIVIDNNIPVIEQDIVFTQLVHFRELEIKERLNQILVRKKKLDVLLKNSPEKQYITGEMTFSNLTLLQLVKLQGKINDSLDKINPFLTIDRDIVVTGDFKILGNVVAENEIVFNDIVGHNEPSLNIIKNHGLRLNSEFIPNKIRFESGLTTENIRCNSINNINCNSFIVNGDNQVIITARKNMKTVWFNGIVHIFSINEKNLLEQFDNSLQLGKNQTITGKHYYKKIVVEKITGSGIFKNVNESVSSNERNLIIDGLCAVKHLEAKFIQVHGKINNLDLDELVSDTVFVKGDVNVIAFKRFDNDVVYDNFQVNYVNGINMNEMKTELEKWANLIQINNMNIVKEKINIITLYSNYLFGDMKYNDFGTGLLCYTGDYIMNNQRIRNLNATISFTPNHSILYDLYNSMVRDNEEHFFENAIFSGLLLSDVIKLETTNMFDLNTLLLSQSTVEQFLSGVTEISKNLTVNGHFFSNGLISNFDLKSICDLQKSGNVQNEFHIIGSINIQNNSNIRFINDVNINELISNTWNIYDDVYLPGYLHTNDMNIKGKLFVQGFVSNVNLKWLSKNYFSKSKDQNVISKLNFRGNIVFEHNLHTPNLTTPGTINDIDITTFSTTSIRHNIQNIPTILKLSHCTIERLETFSLVNKLNLSLDIMRYDVIKNVFHGKKIVSNVFIDNLITPPEHYIQEINVNVWLDNAVLLTEIVNIPSLKTFKNVDFQTNVECKGPVNSFLISNIHILSRSQDQILSGKKLFNSNNSFKNLKVNKLLNSIDFDKLIENQVFKHRSSIIASGKYFQSPIISDGFNCLFNCQNQNIELLLQRFKAVENLYSFEKEFGGLKEVSEKLLTQKKCKL